MKILVIGLYIHEMVEDIIEKYDKYWEDFRDILAMAAVFNPRLKFSFLEYCYNSLDPSTGTSNLAFVRKKMVQVFGTYRRNTGNVTATTFPNFTKGYSIWI